jgi:hypothetical protein
MYLSTQVHHGSSSQEQELHCGSRCWLSSSPSASANCLLKSVQITALETVRSLHELKRTVYLTEAQGGKPPSLFPEGPVTHLASLSSPQVTFPKSQSCTGPSNPHEVQAIRLGKRTLMKIKEGRILSSRTFPSF